MRFPFTRYTYPCGALIPARAMSERVRQRLVHINVHLWVALDLHHGPLYLAARLRTARAYSFVRRGNGVAGVHLVEESFELLVNGVPAPSVLSEEGKRGSGDLVYTAEIPSLHLLLCETLHVGG